MTLVKSKFKVEGMVCDNCEKIIAKQVLKLPGVKSIDVDYPTEMVEVEYNQTKTDLEQIKEKINEKGYICVNKNDEKKKEKHHFVSYGKEKKKYGPLAWAFATMGFIIICFGIINWLSLYWNVWGICCILHYKRC